MSSQPPDFPTEPPYPQQEIPAVTPPQRPLPWNPPQPPQGRRTLAQRIEGLTTSQTIALGLGVGCSILLVACIACSAVGLALGWSNPTQGSGSAIVAIPTATATDDATAVAESTATINVHPTATTHAQSTNTPRSHPTNTPCPSPCNPWGYNFNATGGTKITNPHSAFCSYFACVGTPPQYATFWSGTGYVVECIDNKFSKTGGHNTCSQDGGYLRTLYAH